MSRHQTVLIILLAVVSSFWIYVLYSVSDINDFGDTVIRIVKETDRRQNAHKGNSIPIRKANSFTARVKREASEEKIAVEPIVEMTKSSQQIQFTPGYFYGNPGSIDSNPMTWPPQFCPMPLLQQANDNAFTPGYLPFQANGQIACFPNPELAQNPFAPFYCIYVPARPPPVTYQFPAMPGIPDFNTVPKKNGDSSFAIVENLNPPANPITEYTRGCPVNYFPCDDGSKCVHKFQWCDNKIDCPDSSDERKCSCRERLDRRRLCDNYLDCPHGEDELGCFGCDKTSFSCHDGGVGKLSRCFKLKERCDGNLTCTNAKDEEDCTILTRTYNAGTDLGVFPVGYFHGFVQRNFKGKWYHVCGRANSWAWEACAIKLGHLSTKPQQEFVISPNHQELGPFLLQSGRMIRECPQQILFVHCPDPSRAAKRPKSSNNTPNQNASQVINANNSSSDPIVSIVGGRPSTAGAWPFVVAINMNGLFHCGGAIVNPYWILSAAHCFFGSQNKYYDIDAGTIRRHSFSPAHQIRHSEEIVIHENFNSKILTYDIALMRLNEPLDFNEWVGPVTLPKPMSFSGWNMEPNPGATCVALGWGSLVEDGPDPDHLHEVEVPIVPCRHSRDRNLAEICAGYVEGGRDACQGDSGGPLMCRDSYFDWYIGGVVSHGIGCARVLEPGAYTKVSYFVWWIDDVINERATPSIFLRPLDKCPGFSCHPPFDRCLPANKRCDGIVDCLEAEDEGNCPQSLIQDATDLFNGLFGIKRQVKQEASQV